MKIVDAFQLGHEGIPDWFWNRVNTNEIILRGEDWGPLKSCDITNSDGSITHFANRGDWIIQLPGNKIQAVSPAYFKLMERTGATQ